MGSGLFYMWVVIVAVEVGCGKIVEIRCGYNDGLCARRNVWIGVVAVEIEAEKVAGDCE